MFRKDRSIEEINFLKKLQEDKFLKERLVQANKLDLSYKNELQKDDLPVNIFKPALADPGKECSLEDTNDKAIAENKRRQQVRQNSPEIRELESKLRLAYTNKLRSVQIAERNVILERERIEELENARIFAQKIAEEEEEQQLKDAELQRQKVEYKKTLDEQVAAQNAQLLSHAYLDFLKEKMLIDETVAKIIEEDRKKFEANLRKTKEFRDEIEWYLVVQQEHRRNEEKVRKEENRKILAYISYKDLELQEKRERLQASKSQSERVRDRLLAVLEEKEMHEEDARKLRIDLACESKTKEDDRIESEIVQKQARERLRLRQDLEQQLDFNQQMRELEKEEDQRLKEEMLQQLALEHRLDQLSSQKRRLKQMEHRRSVEALIRQRQVEREQIELAELEDLRKLQQMQADRQRMVEQERLKILQEHASKLVGYLPKGVLQKSHLEVLGIRY